MFAFCFVFFFNKKGHQGVNHSTDKNFDLIIKQKFKKLLKTVIVLLKQTPLTNSYFSEKFPNFQIFLGMIERESINKL